MSNTMTISHADRFLDLPNIRAHLVDWEGPADQPTIVLLHGLNLTSNATVWHWVAPLLTPGFRVLALDQRSHGLTNAPSDNDFSFAALCGDMHLVCEQLGVHRPIVVGHSWGGDLALQYAGRHADNVAGVVLVDGGFVGINKVMTWPQAQTFATPLQGCTRVTEIQAQAKHWLGESFSPAAFEFILNGFEVRADQTIAPRVAFDAQLEIARAQWEQDAETLYAQVRCPALFLPCLPQEHHDPTPKQFLAWKKNRMALVQTLMPHAQIEWLADSIHDVQLQRPELVAERIYAFAKALA